MKVKYRYSIDSDADELQALFDLAFGKLDGSQSKELYHRYLLATVDDKIVAATGLSETDYTDGLEIDWTCTHPDYQRQGIMKELFSRILAVTDQRVYCSCWKTGLEEVCHLKKLMDIFNFKRIIPQRLKCTYPYSCNADRHATCPYRDDGGECSCTEDLYLYSPN